MVDQIGADRAEAVWALRRPRPQFGDDEVVQRAALGVAGAGHRQDVAPQPADQRRHVIGHGHGGGRGRPGVPQLLADAAVTPALAVFALGLLALELGAGLEGLVGTVVQEGDDGSQLVQDVEDVAAPGDVGQGQRLPGLETAAGVTDDGLRREAVRLQLQQADAPGDPVAVLP